MYKDLVNYYISMSHHSEFKETSTSDQARDGRMISLKSQQNLDKTILAPSVGKEKKIYFFQDRKEKKIFIFQQFSPEHRPTRLESVECRQHFYNTNKHYEEKEKP